MNESAGVGAHAIFKLRPEVVAIPRWRGLQRYWVLKQAMTLDHYEVTDDEWFLLRCLDGVASPDKVRRLYNERHRPRVLTESALSRFLHRACEIGVVGVTGKGRAETLADQDRRSRRRRAAGRLLSIAAPSFSLLDPTPLLRVLSPVGRVLFSRTTLALAALVAVGVLIVALGRVEEIAAAASIEGLLDGRGWLALLALWCLVKLLHELGHGLACHRFGGECHDAGLFLIAGFPVLYCDVSDAWTFPNLGRRAIVSAAGVYVEVLVAIGCGALWLLAEPGLVRELAGQAVAICGINTLVFNANPLLKLDGYYLVADLTNRPNLSENSRKAWTDPVMRWLSHGRLGGVPEPQPLWLHLYGAASFTYRLFVAVAIAWVIWSSLDGVGLGAIGAVLIALSAASVIAPSAVFIWRMARSPNHRAAFLPIRVAMLLVAASAALAGALLLPIPDSVRVPAMVAYAGAQDAVAPAAGRLVSKSRYGDHVGKGETIAVIDDPVLRVELLDAKAFLSETRRERELADNELAYSEVVAARVEALIALERAASDRLAALQAKQAELRLIATRDGVLSPPAARHTKMPEDAMGVWQGTVLDPENAGAWLTAGDPIAIVADPRRLIAHLIVEQSEVDRIADDAEVRLRMANAPGITLRGKVVSIGRHEVSPIDPALLASGAIDSRKLASGIVEPVGRYFLVEARLDETGPALALRSTGWARITTSRRTVGQWLWREINRLLFAA